MLQEGWRWALRTGRTGARSKRPDAAGVFSALVVSDSGKGRDLLSRGTWEVERK